MFIPLSYFVDRSIAQQPKGLLVNDGLVSAMRNPLYDGGFKSQIVFDARLRDNWSHTMRSSLGGNVFMTDSRRNERMNAISVIDDDQFFATEFGITTSEVAAAELRSDLSDSSGHSVAEFEMFNNNVVIATTIYIPTEQILGSSDLILSGMLLGGSSKMQWQIRRKDASTNEIFFHDSSFSKTFDLVSSDYGKFLLFVLIKLGSGVVSGSLDEHDISLRLIGGSHSSVLETTISSAINPTSDNLQIPVNTISNTAFSTFAIYSGNNDNGVNGLDISHLNYDIFENQHVCGSHIITGNQISFSCENRVAFEIKSGGTWFNTNGTTGSGNRVFFDTGNYTIDTMSFTEIRPVLQNSGLLNADILGKISSMSVTPIGNVYLSNDFGQTAMVFR